MGGLWNIFGIRLEIYRSRQFARKQDGSQTDNRLLGAGRTNSQIDNRCTTIIRSTNGWDMGGLQKADRFDYRSVLGHAGNFRFDYPSSVPGPTAGLTVGLCLGTVRL